MQTSSNEACITNANEHGHPSNVGSSAKPQIIGGGRSGRHAAYVQSTQ